MDQEARRRVQQLWSVFKSLSSTRSEAVISLFTRRPAPTHWLSGADTV